MSRSAGRTGTGLARSLGSRVGAVSARTPLRIRLVGMVLVLVAVALLGSGFAATAAMRGFLVDQVDHRLDDALVQARRVCEYGNGRLAGLPPRNFGGLGSSSDDDGDTRQPSQFFIACYDADGVLGGGVRPSTEDTTPDVRPTQTVAQARKQAGQPYAVPSTSDEGTWRVATAVLENGSGSVLVAQSMRDVEDSVHRMVLLEAGIGSVTLVLIAGLSYLTVRRSLRPLVAVERTAVAIAEGNLSRRVPAQDPRTEVGRLAAAMNGMLHQIEVAFRKQESSEAAARASAASARASEERMRRFVADASHELRTPLTSIRGFAELYRQQSGGGEVSGDGPRFMRRIEDEARRMGLLVDDLLLLARLDQQRPLERREVDLLTLVADAVHDARAVAPDRPIDLDVVPGPDAPVVIGDESRLRQVLGNLVGNALTHTPAGTPVTVRLRDGGAGTVVLEVQDAGPGLSPQDQARVFERFYRSDDSRTRASGGSGLGLSIVAALTAAHGGRVEVESAPGAGATFRVVLPRA